MHNVKHILFPTDFSDCAAQAFEHALFMARDTGATLHALHVVVLTAPGWAAEREELVAEREAEVGGELEALLRARDLAGVNVKKAVHRAASAGEGILAHAEEQEVDLIVLGTHGRRGVRRLLLGSEAEDVIRHAECPVLAVPERDVPFPAAPLNHIVVPVDFSEHSERALTQAQALAAQHEARITLLHLLERHIPPAAYGDVPVPPPQMTPAMRESAEEALQEQVQQLSGVEADYAVEEGRPAASIAAFAEEHAADLIVMASHGRTGVKRLLAGSVTERVTRRAPCPVFVVKSFGERPAG